MTWSIRVGPTKKPSLALQAEAAPVDNDLGAFLFGGGDPLFDPRLVFGRDDGAVIGLGIVGDADAQARDGLQQLLLELLAVSSPTGTTTGSAMHRSPAEPKAAPVRSVTT